MNKVTLKLSGKEWVHCAQLVLEGTGNVARNDDKYMKAILQDLLIQVYRKFHNRLHSLRPANNSVTLTFPEAAVLSLTLQELNVNDYVAIDIIAIIDQKLT